MIDHVQPAAPYPVSALTHLNVYIDRFLLLPLIDAERAWAYAMQLKSEANTEPRKRFHMISRLRKAVQHADALDRLCNESGVFDARSKLEVQVSNFSN